MAFGDVIEPKAGAAMVGALSAHPDFPVERDVMLQAVRDTVPEKAVEINLSAFENGYNECRQKMRK